MTVPGLTDADVQRILPILRAEAAQRQEERKELGQKTQQMAKQDEQMQQRIRDFESGRTDPLAYLKQHARHVTAPPSAAYKPKLSRLASLWAYGSPIAVFSYGIDSEAARTLARGGEAAAQQYANLADLYKGPAGQKIKAAEQEFKSFYAAKGFKDFTFTKVPGWSCVSPDGGTTAWFVFVNLYAGARDVEPMADGPILELRLSDLFSGDERPQPMEKTGSAPPMSLEQALRQAGMNEEQYRTRLGARTMARNDAADPSAIDAEARGFNYEGPMDPDMKKTLEGMKAFYETRRQNAMLYKRHAAVLDPLLSALGQ